MWFLLHFLKRTLKIIDLEHINGNYLRKNAQFLLLLESCHVRNLPSYPFL